MADAPYYHSAMKYWSFTVSKLTVVKMVPPSHSTSYTDLEVNTVSSRPVKKKRAAAKLSSVSESHTQTGSCPITGI